MIRIVFIGAGSMIFTRKLVMDILSFSLLQDAKLVLMDIDEERLDYARRLIQQVIDAGSYPASVEATTNRAEALNGADIVLVTILASSVNVWRHDIEIPKKYGVDINVGDTRGPAGIFRALRTIPVMIGIARDMERHCPDAYMLNYTNPMAMICRALQRETNIKIVGLCHSVQSTIEMLSRWIGCEYGDIDYICAGINHLAWFLKFEKDNQDAYPMVREAILSSPEIYNEEIVRNEMFLHLDYYVTESSGHNSEYNWWFRKRPDLIEKYCVHGTGWNPGEYAYILKHYLEQEQSWRDEVNHWLNSKVPMPLRPSREYAAYIINALKGGEPAEFNGNVANTGLITNLPIDACVEVPIWATRKGFNPVYVGALPPQCAVLTHISVSVEEMAVEAAINGDPRMVFQAIVNDPLTAAVLSLNEIKSMVNEMLHQNMVYLPTFKHFKS